MSNVKSLYDKGDLRGAIEALTQEIKANPADMTRRIFLFELLSFAGEWERAGKQLDVIGAQSPKAEIGVAVYKNLLACEQTRARLLSDALQPHFLADPPDYVDWHMDAINRIREGNIAEAVATLDRAEEERPATRGQSNGTAFGDFRDFDDMFAPVFEVFVQDKYTWIPVEQVRRIELSPPTQLRDLLWLPAKIETADRTLQAFLPTLYPGSSLNENDMVRLGRMTDWVNMGEELYRGCGLRVFALDGEEKSILQLGTVDFTVAVAEAGTASN